MLLAVELFLALASLLLAVAAQRGSVRAWRLEHHPIDFAMRVLTGLWTVFLLISVAQVVAANQLQSVAPLPEVVKNIVCEFLLASVAFFLLTASGTVKPWVVYAVAVQLLGGLTLFVWLNWFVQPSPALLLVWSGWHLASFALITAWIARQTRHTRSRRSWLALAACAMGLGLWLYQEAALSVKGAVLPASFYLYAFFLFVVWKLVSLNADADKAIVNAGTSFVGTTGFQPLASMTTNDEFISLAVRGERQRIAHELHDNIGSHIVSILFAMQAANQPQKRFVMLSLEQCLSDLKMTVDALHSFDESVTLALGRLRYRVQPALDRQAIKMRWEVEICDELDAVGGIYAQQVLRIAQESLANVMRHSNADSVKVVCRYMPEFCHLLLEVRDNGKGIAVDKNQKSAGRGLEAMKRRAAAVGGFLVISSREAGGTSVRLTLPLPHLKTTQKSLDL